jgi:WD40 repeat protein
MATKPSSHVCVVTARVSPPVIGSSQTTDTVQILDPQTGAVLSANGGAATLKVGSGVGVHSFSPVPLDKLCISYSTHDMLYIAYGGKHKDDMHAHLVVQGSTSSPKWRCRVPEYMEGGIIVSRCGNYAIGAGRSGQCYCWSLLQDGELLRIWSAHYRAVQSVIFSDCGSYLITGGADGIVNMWSLMDIVSEEEDYSVSYKDGNASLKPVRTWSEHQLPISALHALPSSRIVSTSQDRHVIIMELFSGITLAKIQMPSAITAVTSDSSGHRLYLGSNDGTIFCVDMDSYAIATTAESATAISNSKSNMDLRGPSLSGTLLEETMLGAVKNNSGSSSFICELRNHESTVTSLALVEDHGSSTMLISGDENGAICMWDLRFRICIRTLHPWTTSGMLGTENTQKKCPCSNILIVPRETIESKESSGIFITHSTKSVKQNSNSLVNLIRPFQRFPKSQMLDNEKNDTVGYLTKIITNQSHITFDTESSAIYSSKRSMSCIPSNSELNTHDTRKKSKVNDDEVERDNTHHDNSGETQLLENEIERLNSELRKANNTIERWQKVNTKLALKLKNGTN